MHLALVINISIACSVPGVLKQAVYPAGLGRVRASPGESEAADAVQPPLSRTLASGLAGRAIPAADCSPRLVFAAALLCLRIEVTFFGDAVACCNVIISLLSGNVNNIGSPY